MLNAKTDSAVLKYIISIAKTDLILFWFTESCKCQEKSSFVSALHQFGVWEEKKNIINYDSYWSIHVYVILQNILVLETD